MLHTRKQFSALCGITHRELSVYITRGKVIERKKKIDDTLPENIEFMEGKQNKGSVKRVKVEVKPPMTQEEEESFHKRLIDQDHRSKLNTKIKEREHEKVSEEIELLKIKRQKLEGYFIPTELVKILVAQEFKQFTVSFQQGADILIMEISKKKS